MQIIGGQNQYMLRQWTLVEQWAAQPRDEIKYRETLECKSVVAADIQCIRNQMVDGERWIEDSPWSPDWYVHGKNRALLFASLCKVIVDCNLSDGLAIAIKSLNHSGPIWSHGIIVRAAIVPDGVTGRDKQMYLPFGRRSGFEQ